MGKYLDLTPYLVEDGICLVKDKIITIQTTKGILKCYDEALVLLAESDIWHEDSPIEDLEISSKALSFIGLYSPLTTMADYGFTSNGEECKFISSISQDEDGYGEAYQFTTVVVDLGECLTTGKRIFLNVGEDPSFFESLIQVGREEDCKEYPDGVLFECQRKIEVSKFVDGDVSKIACFIF